VVKNQGVIQGLASGLVLTGAVSGAGNYQGTVTFDGSFGPGNSPALVTGENLIFGATNQLFIEIGGTTRGSQYDAIDADTLNLNGELAWKFINLGSGGFNAQAGDYFDILMAQDITGDFTNFNFTFAALDAGLYWTHELLTLNGFEVYRLEVAGSPDGGTVPEPATLFLVLLALYVLRLNMSRHGKMPRR
jgi:hypothetical protein